MLISNRVVGTVHRASLGERAIGLFESRINLNVWLFEAKILSDMHSSSLFQNERMESNRFSDDKWKLQRTRIYRLDKTQAGVTFIQYLLPILVLYCLGVCAKATVRVEKPGGTKFQNGNLRYHRYSHGTPRLPWHRLTDWKFILTQGWAQGGSLFQNERMESNRFSDDRGKLQRTRIYRLDKTQAGVTSAHNGPLSLSLM